MNWKKCLMLVVILGGIACMVLSFVKGEWVVGVLSGLTVIVPAVIWYSDDKENQMRDKILAEQEEINIIQDQVLESKADAEQGFYDKYSDR